jgi:hypothetical protein
MVLGRKREGGMLGDDADNGVRARGGDTCMNRKRGPGK